MMKEIERKTSEWTALIQVGSMVICFLSGMYDISGSASSIS